MMGWRALNPVQSRGLSVKRQSASRNLCAHWPPL